MNVKDLLVHTGIGTLATAVLAKPIGNYIDRMQITEEEKRKYKAMGEGVILGGVIGHGIGKQVNTGNPNYTLKDQCMSVGIFAIASAAAAYAISSYVTPKNGSDADASDNAKDETADSTSTDASP